MLKIIDKIVIILPGQKRTLSLAQVFAYDENNENIAEGCKVEQNNYYEMRNGKPFPDPQNVTSGKPITSELEDSARSKTDVKDPNLSVLLKKPTKIKLIRVIPTNYDKMDYELFKPEVWVEVWNKNERIYIWRITSFGEQGFDFRPEVFDRIEYTRMNVTEALKFAFSKGVVGKQHTNGYEYISRGNGNITDQELFSVSHAFLNGQQIIEELKQKNPSALIGYCKSNPYYINCDKLCPYNTKDKGCIEYLEGFCKDKYGKYEKCQQFAEQNKELVFQEVRKICTNLDEMTQRVICENFFTKNAYDCGGEILCETSQTIYKKLCENSSDSRCKCINHQQLERGREESLKKFLEPAIANTKKTINDAIKQNPRFEKRLREIEPEVIDKIREYYYYIAYGFEVVPPQCLIAECRNGTLPMTQQCKLTTFIAAFCFNSIDINNLMNGRITFKGDQKCNINININCGPNGECGQGQKCSEGKCRKICVEEKCDPNHKCVDGICQPLNNKPDNGKFNWTYLIYALIAILIIVLVYINL